MIYITKVSKAGSWSDFPYKHFKFNGGEHFIKLSGTLTAADEVSIYFYCKDGEIMELALVVDAIRQINPNIKISLIMPYIPYARQDRVMEFGQSLSVAVFCKMINSMKFSSVLVDDPHSDVAVALLDNVIVRHQHNLLESTVLGLKVDALVAPDAGALKKIHQLATNLKLPIVTCLKTRDVSTGNITGIKVCDSLDEYSNVCIVDDICDGGRTFVETAKSLKVIKPELKVNLVVTHGIFANGKDLEAIDYVWAYHDWTKN